MNKLSYLVLLTLLLLGACQPVTETTDESSVSILAADNTDRIQVWLTELTDEVIIPRYQKLHMSSEQMLRRSERFCLNSPDEFSLQSARHAWMQLLSDWHYTEAFLFGPAVKNDRDLHLFYRFPKAKVINRLLSRSQPLTLEDIDEAGIGAQGIATLEYLLFSYEQTSSEIVAAFTNAETAKLRCSLLIKVAEDLENRLNDLLLDWTKTDNNFRTSLLRSGVDSPVFSSQQEVLDQVISKLYQSVETSAQRRRNSESFYSGMGFIGAHSTLKLAEQVFEQGLEDLLLDIGRADLAIQLQTQFNIINKITVPIDMFHRRDGYAYFKELDDYFNAALSIANLFRHDLATALNLQITLFDADGDF